MSFIYMNTKDVLVVNSVLKSIALLEALAQQGDRRLSDLARDLSMAKSTVHGILETMEAEGLVERSPEGGSYHLGVRLIELGNRAQLGLDICRISAPFLTGLNAEFDETVHLTVLDHDQVLYVDCVESKKRLRTYSVIGVRAPLYCTSVGKAIMAWLPESEIRRIAAEKGLPKITETTLTSIESLMTELERTRVRGWALDDCEHEEHLRCVGAPVRNSRGEVFASLSLSGPAERNTLERLEEIAPRLVQATSEISRRLGYRAAGA
ncbi:MAG TPA: IclR family transcriptional regulator [Rectinemataceae bacterium]|nr:IclR family transcriptional regulator [Rectinemataceae bacterium]